MSMDRYDRCEHGAEGFCMLCCREGEGKGETDKEREERRKREIENAPSFEEATAAEDWFDD